MTKTVAIIGSHGLFANYGGWDQLVNNLCLKKNNDINYIVFNSRDTQVPKTKIDGIRVIKLPLKANGIEGLFFDFLSIFICYFYVDVLLLLGAQGIPLVNFLQIVKRRVIVVNPGGVEWERPKFSYLTKLYLKYIFKKSSLKSDNFILDNEYYLRFLPSTVNLNSIKVIPYGGFISNQLNYNDFLVKYKFLNKKYFLSVSRALKDNLLEELCDSFSNSDLTLVLISNFNSSNYGRQVKEKYKSFSNIILIDGLYIKDELDLVRRHCSAYVHTHTLCGTAPSLVEMVVCGSPILYIDVPQNNFTMKGEGFAFDNFNDLVTLLSNNDIDLNAYRSSSSLKQFYTWENIVSMYENSYNSTTLG
jgi:hypothetical protein